MIQVIKIGGNVVDSEQMLSAFTKDFASFPGPKILVHGGGVMASRMMKDMGMEPVMVEGRRVTDADTLKVVTMVYAGWCNKDITARLQAFGCNAIGLSGCDANVIKAHKRAPKKVGDSMVDYGYVGDVNAQGVNAPVLQMMLRERITPVLCAINHDGKGGLLNTNADTIAQSVAVALSAAGEQVQLVYCFEKNGVLSDKDDDSSVIPVIIHDDFVNLKASGVISDGMIPKLENAFEAIGAGVDSVRICHALSLASGGGTLLKK